MCWFRKELEMPNSRVIQMQGSEGGGVGKVQLRAGGERAAGAFGVSRVEPMVGFRDELQRQALVLRISLEQWPSEPLLSSPAMIPSLCDLGNVSAPSCVEGIKPLSPVHPVSALSAGVLLTAYWK